MNTPEYNTLLKDAKAYLNARYDLLRLELLEKLSRIIGLILLALVIVLLIFGAFAFFGMALVFLLSKVVPLSVSCCILGGVFLLVIALAYIFKNQWFITPIVRQLSKILFTDSDSKAVMPGKTEQVEQIEEEVRHE